MRELLRDVRFGARLIRKSPVVSMTAVLVVALAIAAATTIYTVAYGVMLRPLPFRDPDRLMSIWLERHSERNYPAAADAVDLRRMPTVFQDVALLENVNLNLVGDCAQGSCEPEHLEGARVSANPFFNPRRPPGTRAHVRRRRRPSGPTARRGVERSHMASSVRSGSRRPRTPGSAQ